MAWQIIKHAFVLIFNNFNQAVKVSVAPMALLVVLGLLLLPLSGLTFDVLVSGILQGNIEMDANENMTVAQAFLVLLFAVLTLFVVGWIAVSWHRFILLEEYTNLLPAISGRPIWPYIGKSFFLGLTMVGISIPVMLLLGVSLGQLLLSSEGSVFGEIIFGLLVTSIIGFFWFRLAVCLPAIAVGKDMTYGEAWSNTAPVALIIFQVSVISAAFNNIAPMAANQLFSAVPGITFIFLIIVNWVTMMVGVSVLTTLYGHLVEGRALAGSAE